MDQCFLENVRPVIISIAYRFLPVRSIITRSIEETFPNEILLCRETKKKCLCIRLVMPFRSRRVLICLEPQGKMLSLLAPFILHNASVVLPNIFALFKVELAILFEKNKFTGTQRLRSTYSILLEVPLNEVISQESI